MNNFLQRIHEDTANHFQGVDEDVHPALIQPRELYNLNKGQ